MSGTHERLPAYLDRELGLAEAERMTRLLGLRLKYLISIPIGAGFGYLAALAGAGQMLQVVTFLTAQFVYGIFLGIWERRRARRLAQR